MKKLYITLGLLALLAFGCSDEDSIHPDQTMEADDVFTQLDADKRSRPTVFPNRYYSMFWNEEIGNYSDFSRINKHTGNASLIWQLDAPIGGDGENSFGWAPFGLTFDVDGTMYVTLNVMAFTPDAVLSQFARVDTETGEIFNIGDTVPFNTGGGDIDACGNFYVCGFEVPALGYIWGNDSLWRVDKVTGEFTEVGPTGHTHWMDLAFDRDGVLWGTFDNELYTIDTETGASTFITEIHDVPDAGEPRLMEIMSIAFDKHDVLYGTGLTVYWLDPNGSPVMKIDPQTGETELLGYSHTSDYNHGGDILPTRVQIAHLNSDGEYECVYVSMRSLPAHLAHGDYVPGSAGHDCDCP